MEWKIIESRVYSPASWPIQLGVLKKKTRLGKAFRDLDLDMDEEEENDGRINRQAGLGFQWTEIGMQDCN